MQIPIDTDDEEEEEEEGGNGVHIDVESSTDDDNDTMEKEEEDGRANGGGAALPEGLDTFELSHSGASVQDLEDAGAVGSRDASCAAMEDENFPSPELDHRTSRKRHSLEGQEAEDGQDPADGYPATDNLTKQRTDS